MPSPIKGKTPSTPYRKLGSMWKATGYHTGVDYAVPVGTDVHAVADGKVTSANWGAAYGQQLVTTVNGGWFIYAHLSATLVKPGDVITAGQVIGKSGNSGNSSGPHLHVELRSGIKWSTSKDLDPYLLIGTQKASVATKAKTKVIAPIVKKK